MREFTVVKHELCNLSAPDSRYSVALKSSQDNYIFFEGGADIQREFPIGAKFTLVPAVAIEDVNQSETYKSAIRIVEAL